MKTLNKYKLIRSAGTIDNWLYTRGGRDRDDLKEDKNGQYVMMWDGANKEGYKVYLPKDLHD